MAHHIAELQRTAELLNDLTRYIALGVVEIRLSGMAAPGPEAPDGWHWLELPMSKPQPKTLEYYLYALTNLHVLRCTYKMLRWSPGVACVRVYCLPVDVGRSCSLISRKDKNIKKYMREVMDAVDVSKARWRGQRSSGPRVPLMELDSSRTSLFYMFNTMDSPDPSPDGLSEDDRLIVMNALESEDIPGMKTKPFEYQRRSMAMMLQRELHPFRSVDSRLRTVFSPADEVYYLDAETCEFFEEPRYYDDVCGGILAEEMGTGKTLICLGVILHTQHMYAKVPKEHSLIIPNLPEAPSLMQACVSVIWREGIPWRLYEDQLGTSCVAALKNSHLFYEVPPIPRSRSKRQPAVNTKEKIFLGSGTIIVCPPNLVEQWRTEIAKHVEEGRLKVLVMAHTSARLPPVRELLEYDIVLFSRTCFDLEEREGKDNRGRRESGGVPLSCSCPYIGATRTPDCRCFKKDAVYKSPLFGIRWKRLIVDEGHSMGGSGKTNAVCVAEKLSVEARWLVSGTPSPSLLGAGVGTANMEGETEAENRERRDRLLEARKEFQTRETQDLDRLGKIVRDFFRLQPWAAAKDRGAQASWNVYITRGFLEGRAGSTTCVHNILRRLMVRHKQEDIERSIMLPPLFHKHVYLKPRYTEKISINLFLCQLVVNAVTSERTDKDYLFHPDNRKDLRALVNNLYQQSSFFWTGFRPKDIDSTLKIALEYADKIADDDHRKEDFILLQKAIESGRQALRSETWRCFSKHQDMGYFISDLPDELSNVWTFEPDEPSPARGLDQPTAPLMLTAAPILEMQKHVSQHAYEPEQVLSEGLRNHGTWFMTKYNEGVDSEKSHKQQKGESKRGLTDSSTSSSGHKNFQSGLTSKAPPENAVSSPTKPKKTALKTSRWAEVSEGELPPDSPFLAPTIFGTASTKLSYLLSSILEHHTTEKTLIFYESDNVAWYISQALEVMGIENLAYQKNLPPRKKAQYIVTFHKSERFRVLLMDLTQAAHGLNVCSASRVYFVNPVWTPAIEAQALKRAHRIGQTKPVYCETLILEGTLEEEMVKRRRAMTDKEMKDTRDSMVNDSVMRDIISNLKFLDVDDDESQVASLKVPQSLFGAGKRGGFIGDPDENLLDVDGFEDGSTQKARLVMNTRRPGTGAPGAGPSTSGRKRAVVVTDDDGHHEEQEPARKKTVRFG